MRDHKPQHELLEGVPEPRLWERMVSEPEDAWRAFKAFRDARPPRKQRSVVGFGTMIICQWYNEYKWPERADAFDRHMEHITLLEREAQLKQSAKDVSAEHMAMLQSARHLAQKELDKLLAVANDSNTDAPLLRPTDVIKLSEMVIKLDRLVRGESTEAPDVRTDLSKLSTEELRQFLELRKKLGRSE